MNNLVIECEMYNRLSVKFASSFGVMGVLDLFLLFFFKVNTELNIYVKFLLNKRMLYSPLNPVTSSSI